MRTLSNRTGVFDLYGEASTLLLLRLFILTNGVATDIGE
jgi:hypothetical protein